jgi:hypothetical protein
MEPENYRNDGLPRNVFYDEAAGYVDFCGIHIYVQDKDNIPAGTIVYVGDTPNQSGIVKTDTQDILLESGYIKRRRGF